MNIACVGHGGDNFWVCSMLSKLPEHHNFWIKDEYVSSFQDLLEGMDISVLPMSQRPACVAEGWIASGRFPQWQYPRDCTEDILAFVRRYMNLMANAGRDVLPDAESMLIDFPSLERECPSLPFDIMAVNPDPLSGQAPGWSRSEFDGLLLQLSAKGHRVLATNPTAACPWGNYTFGQIGNLSMKASVIIGVASGPWWATANKWNKTVPRYVCLHPFRLNYGPNMPIKHSQNAEQMRVQLAEDGIL